MFMAFYEFIIIIRQDVPSSEVDKVASDMTKIIKDHDGDVIKTEYWGLRYLAYEIKNNKKGHYYFMGIKATQPILNEINRKLKLSDNVIRSSIIRVKEISKDPSPILKESETSAQEVVDVTSSRTESKQANQEK